MPQSRSERTPVVEADVTDIGVVLTIRGELDKAAGEVLVRTTARVVTDPPSRLDIDLCSLTGFTGEGASALVRCRELCTGLSEGLHYRTGRGPGRDALLAAYADS